MRVDLREVLFIATAVAAAAQPVAVALAATVSGHVSSQTCGYLMAISYCNFFQDSLRHDLWSMLSALRGFAGYRTN